MKCIRSHTDDPYFNLAAEEYLLKQFNIPFYFQYVNRPSVVVGKHQNAAAEIDDAFLAAHGIILARRISGGGAVYHDHGNMNYSFITNESPGDFIKFKKYTAPVIDALQKQGVEAHLGTRNEILAGDRKISGTASHVFKTRVLHHGTLLFNTDLGRLSKCLYVDSGRFTDKAVRSIRSEVVNVRELMPSPPEADVFFDQLFEAISNGTDGAYVFSRDDIAAISELVKVKFSRWEWNYGYSPKYEIRRKLVTRGKTISSHVWVNKGRIERLVLDGSTGIDRSVIERLLVGARHEKQEVHNILLQHGMEPDLAAIILHGVF